MDGAGRGDRLDGAPMWAPAWTATFSSIRGVLIASEATAASLAGLNVAQFGWLNLDSHTLARE